MDWNNKESEKREKGKWLLGVKLHEIVHCFPKVPGSRWKQHPGGLLETWWLTGCIPHLELAISPLSVWTSPEKLQCYAVDPDHQLDISPVRWKTYYGKWSRGVLNNWRHCNGVTWVCSSATMLLCAVSLPSPGERFNVKQDELLGRKQSCTLQNESGFLREMN